MMKLTLSDWDRQQLAATCKTTADPRLRQRCQAILMAARGRRHDHIAEEIAVSPRTVQRWLNAYQAGGREGLRIRWAPGRAPAIPDDLAPEIIAWIKQGPSGCGLDRANWTYGELTTYLSHHKGVTVGATTMRALCVKPGGRPYRPTYVDLKGDPDKQEQARQDLEALKKKAQAGELVWFSQDEARFALLPTLRTTLGIKGHRPVGGNRDCHEYVYLWGVLHLVRGRLTTRLVERPTKSQRHRAAQYRALQAAFARHLREIARAYPAERHGRVVMVVDKASWHQGALLTQGVAAHPHLELYPLPRSSPKLQVIARFWQLRRRRATHHRLFTTMATLKQALRSSVCSYQTLTHRLLTLIASRRKRTKSSDA
jgi:transposase